jgi:hypothetical protein
MAGRKEDDQRQGEGLCQRGVTVPSSGIIDLAIGLTFVFAVTAALSSAVTELVARFLGLRGAYLLTGLRELVDGGGVTTDLADADTAYQNVQAMVRGGTATAEQPAATTQAEQPTAATTQAEQPTAATTPPAQPMSATAALLGGPILGSQGMAGQISSRNLTLAPKSKAISLPKLTAAGGAWSRWAQCRGLPSYISAKSFADAVIDLVVPNAAGETTMATIQQNISAMNDSMPTLKSSLQALAKNANNDVTKFRTAVENWYDDHMDRVSGWYKRHVARITLAFGLVLVVLLNINALTIGRTLYSESTVSTAISTAAAKSGNCSGSQSGPACLEKLQAQLSAAETAGLPIGWGTVRDCTLPGARCNWLDQRGVFSRHGDSGWQLVLVLIGFLIMVISLLPGAQFWFGLLSKLGTLRSTGPKPSPAGS